MEPSPQVLRARELEPCGKRVNTREVVCGHVSDQHVGHDHRISADISAARALTPVPEEPRPLAEIDYLLGQRLGDPARRAFLADLAAGRFTVASLERADYATVADIDARYADLRPDLADCALIVLAHRYETTRLLTFDERHFRTVTPLGGGSFTLLPADG